MSDPNKWNKNFKQRDPEGYRKHYRNWCIVNADRRLFAVCKSKAKTGNREFSITIEWIRERLKIGICQMTGLRFDLISLGSRRMANNFAPSIDRINNDKGYTQNNCQMVVWIYNKAKGTGSHQDVVKFAKALVRNS